MQNTPRGMRLHIGIFGKRNVGKSHLLNSLTRQNISIVSNIAGTTTDPVEKAMELLPLGPVLFLDTAGIDDEGSLGEMRVQKTLTVLDRTDLAIIVSDQSGWDNFEKQLYHKLKEMNIPVISVFNKADLGEIDRNSLEDVRKLELEPVITSAMLGDGIDELKQKIIKLAPEEFLSTPSIVSDLIPPGELAILVVPIDLEAPKGRLILPQVQTIRDLLDNDSMVMVVKERELKDALNRLNKPPHIVVTDSQSFLKVSADVPKNVLLTSFSILFARFKGELNEFVRGTLAIDSLKTNDKVLICESCTHHAIGDDIGRVKIPRWLTQYVGGKLHFEHYAGHDFPENIADYKLIIHCGACMTNRREVLSRIMKSRQVEVPITNYGLTIAYSLGIFERALEPFPLAKHIYEEVKMASK
ncbi:MAG: [FeFe] hydrogenase H-cluster maturation GTPase HydF [Candidatus Melainabacteria bacterium RIFOXYA2_FULL_32_9]|nr:MAG: [FeFe] hydrogenase H-cluster maturation GTPase HydF [Candidatus Melainabacteria bacterium RIFOXYA2_FULL_32_9]